MAELIITEEERRTLTFLEWDDAALGKAVKKLAMIFPDNDGGRESLPSVAAGVFLISRAIDAGADRLVLKLDGATNPEPLGDWEITIKQLAPPPAPEEESRECA